MSNKINFKYMVKVIETRHGRTQMRCLNLPATGDTLVVAPNFKKERIQFIIIGEQIAEQIAANKETRKNVFNRIKEEYKLYRATL